MTTSVFSEIMNVGKQVGDSADSQRSGGRCPVFDIEVSEPDNDRQVSIIVRDLFVVKALSLYLIARGMSFAAFHQDSVFYNCYIRIPADNDDQLAALRHFLNTLPDARPTVSDNAAFIALMWQWFLADDVGEAGNVESS